MKKVMYGLILAINFVLIGCGGDSSGDNSVDITDTTIYYGTFIDAPVEGLQYQTATQSGVTNDKGEFKYKRGETVTFNIGTLILGGAEGSSMITPLSLTGENDLSSISVKATNIARVLQSLDANSTNNGVITLSSLLQDLNVSNIDFESEADLNLILSRAQDLTSTSYTLKSANDAQSDMVKFINLYNTYELLTSGTYTGIGTKYYLLIMPKNGNIGYGFRAYSDGLAYVSADVFDENLNQIPYTVGSSTGNLPLSALSTTGKYILRVDYTNIDNELTVTSFVL